MWIKLTNEYSNLPIWVNMSHAMSVRRDKGYKYTTIIMAYKDPILVTESPNVIFEKIEYIDLEWEAQR
jgi:hypothetical protein